ncbi:hypothetical protein AMTR_s00046p00041330 [Amborella trichopoda]|uniref:Uncharacterized protein n=1 Tax=Amborella trichopoda TaxID=13333 RepID=U5D6Q4_AMBTC|nr:hypothetical protein AMTR_s00046p00041330 [Amborella trichopoda]
MRQKEREEGMRQKEREADGLAAVRVTERGEERAKRRKRGRKGRDRRRRERLTVWPGRVREREGREERRGGRERRRRGEVDGLATDRVREVEGREERREKGEVDGLAIGQETGEEVNSLAAGNERERGEEEERKKIGGEVSVPHLFFSRAPYPPQSILGSSGVFLTRLEHIFPMGPTLHHLDVIWAFKQPF